MVIRAELTEFADAIANIDSGGEAVLEEAWKQPGPCSKGSSSSDSGER